MAVSESQPAEQVTNYDTVVSYISKEIRRLVPDATNLQANTDLTTDVNIDSVAIMDLVFALEEKYDISIPLNDLADIYKIGELAALIEKLKENA